MTEVLLKVGFWACVVIALFVWSCRTDPSVKKQKRAKRSEIAERFVDKLDKGGPRDE